MPYTISYTHNIFYDKLKFGIHDMCNYKYIKVISVELPKYYNLNEIDFLQEFKRKYFKSDKFDMRIDNVEGILKIKIIPKEIIDVEEIINKFNTDVEKFLNDNKEILTGEIDSFGFSTVINNCVVSNLNVLKDKLEDFLDSYDYYIGVVLPKNLERINRNRRMTFTISIDLVDSSE